LIIAQDDLQRPVEAVLDAPMAAHGLARPLRRKSRRGDAASRSETAAVGKFGPQFDLDAAGGAGQAQFARKAPVAIEPVDFINDADRSLFDAAVALVQDSARRGRFRPPGAQIQ
jgi:hypothetical protein